jgi:hypothetical protein
MADKSQDGPHPHTRCEQVSRWADRDSIATVSVHFTSAAERREPANSTKVSSGSEGHEACSTIPFGEIMHKLTWLALSVLTACATEKVDDGSSPSTQSPNDPAAPGPTSDGVVGVDTEVGTEAHLVASLAGCSEGLSDEKLATSLLLAYDVDASVHELIACGGLTIQVAIGLVTGVVAMVVDDEEVMPGGLSFEGEGVYVSSSQLGESSMTMRVRLYERIGDEYILAGANLFDKNSYLTGVSVEAEGSASVDFDIDDPLDTNVDADASVVISYDEAGPWAKLLGLGDPPPNPIELGDITELDPDFSNIYIETEVEIHDVKGGSDIRVTFATERVGLVDLFDNGNLDYEVVSLVASNAELRQEMTLNAWDIAFVRHGELSGSTSLSVSSSARVGLDYEAVLTYENTAFGEVSFACPE